MACKVESFKLSESQDRRVKLTSEKKEELRELYSTGNYSLSSLAKLYGVSKRLILIIVNDDSAEKVKQRSKSHWRDYIGTKESHAKAIANTRKYKRELYLRGELGQLQNTM